MICSHATIQCPLSVLAPTEPQCSPFQRRRLHRHYLVCPHYVIQPPYTLDEKEPALPRRLFHRSMLVGFPSFNAKYSYDFLRISPMARGVLPMSLSTYAGFALSPWGHSACSIPCQQHHGMRAILRASVQRQPRPPRETSPVTSKNEFRICFRAVTVRCGIAAAVGWQIILRPSVAA